MITFAGGVTLGTFNKEIRNKSKNDTCQFSPIVSHFQFKIIDKYSKSILQISLFNLFLSII